MHHPLLPHRPAPRTAALICAMVLTAVLAGCGDGDDGRADPQESVDVGDIQGDAFFDGVDTWVGEEVTVEARVGRIVDPGSFTITGTENPGESRILVVDADSSLVDEGERVRVTGVVREDFTAAGVEEDLQVDLDDALFLEFEEEHYLQATHVDSSLRPA
ncbi:hypothetical protein [Streptomyces aidingensis]|uniref:Uncharacterized protein n=1 Tax=Streptomyces aidingensis TaxID=910347 RepID=A0A1I1MW07_9ACTN|nr:hypothetical protein [Streptomyces aidingensis]SFC89345.1 hypothetical protein SAMN05421773_10787 [Streptomyces aidingensis]